MTEPVGGADRRRLIDEIEEAMGLEATRLALGLTCEEMCTGLWAEVIHLRRAQRLAVSVERQRILAALGEGVDLATRIELHWWIRYDQVVGIVGRQVDEL